MNNKERKLVWQDTEKRGFLKSTVVGYFAMWAVRQSPYLFPDELVSGIDEFNDALVFDYDMIFDDGCYTEMTVTELEKSVCEAIAKCDTVMSWNVPKSGNACEYVFISRYDTPDQDDDIIDVHAMARNIAHSVWIETCYDDGVFKMNL